VKIVEFAPAARAELDAAADRYELERPGRGQRFYAAVERAVKLIAAFPAAGPAFPDIRPERGVRRRIVRASRSCSRTVCSATPFGSTRSRTCGGGPATGADAFGDIGHAHG
jgi:plasmid stabilization system protein ParE